MPDEQKFAKLIAVGYTIPVTCGLCTFGTFPTRNSSWGTCALHAYAHKKHANPEGGRGVSIHMAGTCPSAKSNVAKVAELGAHGVFLR